MNKGVVIVLVPVSKRIGIDNVGTNRRTLEMIVDQLADIGCLQIGLDKRKVTLQIWGLVVFSISSVSQFAFLRMDSITAIQKNAKLFNLGYNVRMVL